MSIQPEIPEQETPEQRRKRRIERAYELYAKTMEIARAMQRYEIEQAWDEYRRADNRPSSRS